MSRDVVFDGKLMLQQNKEDVSHEIGGSNTVHVELEHSSRTHDSHTASRFHFRVFGEFSIGKR